MNAALAVQSNVAVASRDNRREADAVLLTRMRAGESEATGIFLGRYRKRIINLAYQLLGHRDDAEDVAQEAFTRAFRNIASFRGESDFYTWLYRITVNLCLARKRRVNACDSYHDSLSDSLGNTLTGHSVMAEAETRVALEQALHQLTAPLRAALVLRELQGLSYDEISGILGVPTGTVRSRLFEARRKFRELWDREEL
jgi:RNA polymerase sigma-70 factor (ECF subfamily)